MKPGPRGSRGLAWSSHGDRTNDTQPRVQPTGRRALAGPSRVPMTTSRIAGPAIVLLLFAARLPAQALPGVHPGATVRVETAREVYAGRMLSPAADTLRVETAPGEAVRLPLASVVRVEVRGVEPGARVVLRRALLGLGAGLAGGFLAGSWLEQELHLEGARRALLFSAGVTGLGTGAYSGATARIPGRWRQVHP